MFCLENWLFPCLGISFRGLSGHLIYLVCLSWGFSLYLRHFRMLVPQKYSISGELHLLTSQRYRTLATAGHGSSTYDPLPTWRLSPDPTVLRRQLLGFRADACGLALFWCNSFSWHVSFFYGHIYWANSWQSPQEHPPYSGEALMEIKLSGLSVVI